MATQVAWGTFAKVTGGISGTAPEIFVGCTNQTEAVIVTAGAVLTQLNNGIIKVGDVVFVNGDQDGTPFYGVYQVASGGTLIKKPTTVTNGITAFAGGGQGSAVELVSGINRVTTVATAADSVKLPAAKAGQSITVVNAAASNAMAVFPQTGEIINALSANASLSVAANKAINFYCAVDGTWNSLLTA